MIQDLRFISQLILKQHILTLQSNFKNFSFRSFRIFKMEPQNVSLNEDTYYYDEDDNSENLTLAEMSKSNITKFPNLQLQTNLIT